MDFDQVIEAEENVEGGSSIGANSGVFKVDFPLGREKDSDIEARIEKFKRWVMERPEDKIAVVGHSGTFSYFLEMPQAKTKQLYKGVEFELTQPSGLVQHCEPFQVALFEEDDGSLQMFYEKVNNN